MKPWLNFFPDVLPDVPPDTPEPTVEHALLRAAQDFCQRTRAWRLDLDPFTTQDAVTEYDLELEPQSELVRIESATLNGFPLTVWRVGDAACGQFLSCADGKTLRLNRPMSADGVIVVTACLKPGNTASGVDDALFDRYVTTIALGAVARLNADAGKRTDFEDQCGHIKTQLWRGLAATRPRAAPNFF